MPLFGKSKEKVTQEDAARAKAERLNALPVEDLADEIMPAFWPRGPTSWQGDQQPADIQLADALIPRRIQYVGDLHKTVCEGVQVLEHAGLVQMLAGTRGSIATGAHVKATRLGETALANGDVEQRIKGAAGV